MRRVTGLAGVLAVVLVSACAVIPSSGPVTKAADDRGLGESTVRYSPARPSKGASPKQIVRGYLDAMLGFPTSTGTAAAFLTPVAAKSWSSSAGVRVYGQPEVSPPTVGETADTDDPPSAVEVRLDLVEDARLDQQGRFSRSAQPKALVYRLEQVEGEWRIANPQPGLLVNRKFFSDYFRPFDLFYFDRPGRRLVPDPVYLPVGDQLATALVTSLVRGPLPSPEAATRTFVPELSTLRPSVPVSDDGVADVDYKQDFASLDESTRNHLSAQIVWTLRQVPEIVSVRLVGGSTVLSTDGSTVQTIDSWGAFGPSIARGHAYAIVGDEIVQIDDDTVKPLTGAWGKEAQGAISVAVSDDGVAAVLPGATSVRVTKRNGADGRTFDGTRLITPRWDDDGHVWVVDRPSGTTRVRIVAADAVRALDIGRLAGLTVDSFALSPDGARYAATTRTSDGSRLYVGRILRSADDRLLGLGDPTRIGTDASRPRSATWSSGTELTYLADSESGVQVYTTPIDGSSTIGGASGAGALLPDVGADALAIGTGEAPPRYATDARRRLWFLPSGGSWKLVGSKRFTGLTYGR